VKHGITRKRDTNAVAVGIGIDIGIGIGIGIGLGGNLDYYQFQVYRVENP